MVKKTLENVAWEVQRQHIAEDIGVVVRYMEEGVLPGGELEVGRFLDTVLPHYASIATGGYTGQKLPEELQPYHTGLVSAFHIL